MNASALLFLLILACPLMMIWMMRGHGAHGHGGHGHDTREEPEQSVRELRRRRAELDSLIEQREAEETEQSPALAGRDR